MNVTERLPPERGSLLPHVEGAEKAFLAGRRPREADLESAVRIFLEFLRGFESFEFEQPCVTVFGSARFEAGHRYYDLAREVGVADPVLGFSREQCRVLRAALGESADYLDPIRAAEQAAGVELRG